MQKYFLLFPFLLFLNVVQSQGFEPFELSEEWISKIHEIAPATPTTKVIEKRNVLVFSLHTGFEHWTIPHTEAVIKEVGLKSGVFNISASKNIAVFEKENLKKYDAIILNNNCSIDPRRNLFLDVLDLNPSLTIEEKNNKAQKLEDNLLEYVKEGGGLIVLHAGVTMLNKSMKFSKLVGGSFDYHPKQQKIKVDLVDKNHPMVQAFKGESFEYIDEAYIFNNAYQNLDFRPLLSIDITKIKGIKNNNGDSIKYISWIKKYGKGRVFYCSPSHNPQSFENPKLLQFLLDGIQYAMGDLKCDDSPLK